MEENYENFETEEATEGGVGGKLALVAGAGVLAGLAIGKLAGKVKGFVKDHWPKKDAVIPIQKDPEPEMEETEE